MIIARSKDIAPEPIRHNENILKKVLLKSGMVGKITQIAEATLAQGEATELHHHPTMYEVYFIITGRAIYTVNDQEYEVGPGDLFVFEPLEKHNQRVIEGPHRIFYFGLATD